MTEEEKGLKQLKVFYEKSPQYRTITAGGAWAGMTPQGQVQFVLFNDLRSIPDYASLKVTSEGRVSGEVEEVARPGIIREAEINVVMDVVIAQRVVDALQGMINQIKELKKQEPNTIFSQVNTE